MTKQNQGGMFNLFWVFLIGCFVISMFGKSSPSTSTPSDSLYMSSEEQMGHNYAQIRMQQEGFNSSEAKAAADAIIKFNRAQQNNR